MNELWSILSNPIWWIALVTGGVLQNYAVRWVDSKAATAQNWWNTRSAARRAERRRMIEASANNSEARARYVESEVRSRLHAIYGLALVLVIFELWGVLRENSPESSVHWLPIVQIAFMAVIAAMLLLVNMFLSKATNLKEVISEGDKIGQRSQEDPED